jgi:hypothetical protein
MNASVGYFSWSVFSLTAAAKRGQKDKQAAT